MQTSQLLCKTSTWCKTNYTCSLIDFFFFFFFYSMYWVGVRPKGLPALKLEGSFLKWIFTFCPLCIDFFFLVLLAISFFFRSFNPCESGMVGIYRFLKQLLGCLHISCTSACEHHAWISKWNTLLLFPEPALEGLHNRIWCAPLSLMLQAINGANANNYWQSIHWHVTASLIRLFTHNLCTLVSFTIVSSSVSQELSMSPKHLPSTRMWSPHCQLHCSYCWAVCKYTEAQGWWLYAFFMMWCT